MLVSFLLSHFSSPFSLLISTNEKEMIEEVMKKEMEKGRDEIEKGTDGHPFLLPFLAASLHLGSASPGIPIGQRTG